MGQLQVSVLWIAVGWMFWGNQYRVMGVGASFGIISVEV